MNRLQKLTIAVVLCFAAVPAFAQGGPGPRGRGEFGPPMGPGGGVALERLDRELAFTDAQKSQIEALVSGQREALRTTMTGMRQAEQALAAAVMQIPADDNAIQARANDLAVVQAQLTLARAQLESKIYQLLTPDQQQKAQQWVSQMQQHGGHRGGER